MGYTHYWRRSRETELDAKKFAHWASDVMACANLLPRTVRIAGPMGEDGPEFSDTEVAFNGLASREEDHETFRITPQADSFSFCKTARKPYDTLVVAALALLEDTFPKEVRVSSDGTAKEWSKGLKLARKVRAACKDPDFFSQDTE